MTKKGSPADFAALALALMRRGLPGRNAREVRLPGNERCVSVSGKKAGDAGMDFFPAARVDDWKDVSESALLLPR